MRWTHRAVPIAATLALWCGAELAFATSAEAQLSLRRPRSAATSNVGYVDNAIVGTQIQLRYDVALEANSPDRAEFIYGKCGCFAVLGADPDAPGPVGTLPAGADPLTTPLIETSLDFQEIVLDGEYAFHDRVSVFAEIPLRIVRGDVIPDGSGIGDIQAGFKVAAVADEERYVTFQLKSYLPTGSASDGLGTDHVSLEPGILYHEGAGERLKAEAELKLWIPVDGSSNAGTGISTSDNYYGNVLRYGVGLGYDATPQAQVRFTPVVELVGWRVLSGIGATSVDGSPAMATVADADGTNILNLKLGARFGVGADNSIYLGYGKALTDEVWYDDIFRVEYRLIP